MIGRRSETRVLAATAADWTDDRPLAQRDLRTLAIDALWIIFFVGASGITLPLNIGRLQFFVWFPADLVAIVYLLRHHDLVLSIMKRNAILMVWPALACLSVVWSYAPSASLWYALQLFFTMLVGIMFATYAGLAKAMKLIFVASLVASLLCLFAVVFMPEFARFHTGEWRGLYSHKNQLGAAMVFQIIIGICLLLHGWRAPLTAFGIIVALGLLALSGSGSAFLVICVGLAPLPLVLAYRKGGEILPFTFGVGIVVAAAILTILEINALDPIDVVLNGLGKERTLTGRTLIWDFAEDAFNMHPMLGFGYKGYWESGETTARLLQFVMQQGLTTFHNCYLEVSVGFGIFGPIALVSGLIFVLAVSLRRFLADPSFINAWPMLYVAYLSALCFSESALFVNHGLNDLLLMTIVAAPAATLRVRQHFDHRAVAASTHQGSPRV